MYKSLQIIISLIAVFEVTAAFSQIPMFKQNWVSIGPNQHPTNPDFRRDAGTGPIEFIRVYQKKEGFLLAGSLHGGLFFSDNGGNSWVNSGSDAWTYSGCAWADFYPDNENVWFACSNEKGDNGKPGKIMEEGGIFRSVNKGENWQRIASYKDLAGYPELKIYGTRFHPENPNLFIAITSEGLYYTENCLSDFVKWLRVPNVQGWVYDLDFLNGKMYMTNFFKGKWNLLAFDQNDFSTFNKMKALANETEPMRNVTIEPQGSHLLLAKDYESKSDLLCIVDVKNDKLTTLLERQNISFGSGNTFAVNPHNSDDFFLGIGTRVQRWTSPYEKRLTIGSDYHVDVEFIAYDPFDSLKIYFATHGGVFISNNDAIDWEAKNDGLGVAEVMGLAVSTIDSKQIAIGCYHDGSMVYADFNKDGNYYWRTVNGGDGLIPLIDPVDNATVYTSNQYVGGGLFYSNDTAKTKSRNIHSLNNLKTAGWETAAVIDRNNPKTIYFNFKENAGVNKGNINICRTKDALERQGAEILSDFNLSHHLKSYKVYGLFNSKYHSNVLIAYVLEYTKDSNGNRITNHRLFRTDHLNKTAEEIRKSWYEIEHPRNTWVGDVEIDGNNRNQIYMTYTRENSDPITIFGDKGMVYVLRYSDNSPHKLKREIDISKNIPSAPGGRYNMVYSKSRGGILIIATTTGVYYGTNGILKGRTSWVELGRGLPHCKVYGLDFNENDLTLTVGLFGRGVWQFQMK